MDKYHWTKENIRLFFEVLRKVKLNQAELRSSVQDISKVLKRMKSNIKKHLEVSFRIKRSKMEAAVLQVVTKKEVLPVFNIMPN